MGARGDQRHAQDQRHAASSHRLHARQSSRLRVIRKDNAGSSSRPTTARAPGQKAAGMNEHAPIWRRTRRAGLALVAGLILLPTAAQAASSTATSDGATTTITGSAGADTVDVSSYEGVLTLGGVDAGPGCTQEYPGVGTTVCPIGPGGVDVRTGEGDDRVFVYLDDRPAGYVRADLGGGDDYFEGRAGGDRAFGGPGNDELERLRRRRRARRRRRRRHRERRRRRRRRARRAGQRLSQGRRGRPTRSTAAPGSTRSTSGRPPTPTSPPPRR